MATQTLTLPETLNAALSAYNVGRYGDAERLCRTILAVQANCFDAHHLLALVESALGHGDLALASFDRALLLRPNDAEALSNRGATLHELKRFDAALTSFDRALAIRPDYAEAHNNRGNLLHELKRYGEAIESFDRALALRAQFAEAYNNRGNALQKLERFEEALASYDRALALRPSFPEAVCNRGCVLQRLKRFDLALDSLDRAIAMQPQYFAAVYNRALTLHQLMRIEEALASFDRALALVPDHADAHFNRSLSLLLQGDFEHGWREFEWRWKAEEGQAARRDFSQPLWLGDHDLSGRTILLHAEQGFGDTIQFCRYVKLVARSAATVLLEVPPALKELLQRLDGPAEVIAQGDARPAFDYHCPLMSLPLAFGTGLATIPAGRAYISAAPDKIEAWSRRFPPHTEPRIGLVWAGNPRIGTDANRIDRQRSLTFDQLAPLLAVTGCAFYSLQKGADAVAQLRQGAWRDRVFDWSDELADFGDTAALIANLDLVIAVDTSVAHLAGALGKPLWLMNRFNTCWRWLRDREDSPWYPTARIFRQPSFGDWHSVIARVTAAVAQLRLAAMPFA